MSKKRKQRVRLTVISHILSTPVNARDAVAHYQALGAAPGGVPQAAVS